MSHPLFTSLGFSRVSDTKPAADSFFTSWLYQHDLMAGDGSRLYLALPFGIPRWRLSMLPWPMSQADILRDLAVEDAAGLGQAVESFFADHGGRGTAVPAPVRYRPLGFPRSSTR